ncbi:ATP-dependent RNA helicase RhlB [Entomomonas asaccharolytica]|uniref:ATP-dependent RNA helicase RhlB n=1 Tax=Entomomonas asaccharolytica TaxID=2785331 RepID=A0A974NHI6_9GAMM|nr:ATP-dependent RNA helicase RhlB [Entomomonas asaccharolytica]QQP86710.1 ATP-dependent RNA helicase RhlB [Entomomonas asaccharolytica]
MLKALKNFFTKKQATTPQQVVNKAPSENASQQNNKHKKTPYKKPRVKKQQSANKKLAKTPITDWQLEDFIVAPQAGKTRFHDLFLSNSLMHAIHDLGFTYCTPIQAGVLGHTLKGLDCIGQAQTGTGKTAAFLISIIAQLEETPPPTERYMGEPRALIIAPTRELVIQIAKEAQTLTKYTSLNVMSFVGGMDFNKQLRQIENNYCDILVATPGRLLDFQQRNEIHLDMLEILVLDEADRMLDMGFIPQVRQIIRHTPHKRDRQTLFFSATFTDDVMDLAKQWTTDPAIVEITPETVASDTIEQHIYAVSETDKLTLLYNLIQQNNWQRVIVFANRRDQVRDIEKQLKYQGISTALLSGEVAQNKRVQTLEKFRSGKIAVLIATDVAGRGIHIDGISHVINYNLPETPDDYVHRIGRTGRAGTKGISISLIGEDDIFILPNIEALLGQKLEGKIPPANLLTPLPKK